MRIIVTIIVVVFFSALFSGCDCRHDSGGVVISSTGGGMSNDSARQAEDFLREIELLNSLEGSPCLPETQGAEKIVQTGDRLNSWIKRKRPDESWKSEPEFLEMESIIRHGVTNAESLVRLLSILQGKKVLDENGNQINGSDTLLNECKEVVRHLSAIEIVLETLDKRFGITDLRELLSSMRELKEKFSAIDTIKNINANAIRAFAKQFVQNAEQITVVAAYLKNFATDMRTDDLFIQTSDVYYLIQSIWLRDISNWARGDKQETLERVKNLFDWTICNIAVRSQTSSNQMIFPIQLPWQSVLLGSASELDRAWVFVELLRQQRIDAVMLAVEDEKNVGETIIWGVGVLLDGEIYVFVPEYGTPIPTKDGLTLSENGTLNCEKIATLSQILNDDSLLRQLDVSGTKKFPITSEQLKKTTLFLVASPETVSMRMKVLEEDLSGSANMILYLNINEQRKLLSNANSTANAKVAIWRHPFRAKFDQLFKYQIIGKYLDIFRTTNPISKRRSFPLWSGRILYFKGEITGQNGAMTCYQDARIAEREMIELRANPEFRKDKTISQILQLTTNQAVFWLGIASFERNSIESAKDSMKGLASSSVNIWVIPESYILGRISECEKNYDAAIDYYERASKAAIFQPSFELRAKWIRDKIGKK
jgi:tetratricopeptide (TPR) repeat protein